MTKQCSDPLNPIFTKLFVLAMMLLLILAIACGCQAPAFGGTIQGEVIDKLIIDNDGKKECHFAVDTEEDTKRFHITESTQSAVNVFITVATEMWVEIELNKNQHIDNKDFNISETQIIQTKRK